MNVTLRLDYREDGGLRVSSPDMPGLILSGEDRDAVMRQVIPAIDAIREHSSPLNFRDSWRAVTQCWACGIQWRGPMGYVCPHVGCPVQFQVTS